MKAKPAIHVPVEIGRAGAHDVKIRWDDGQENVYAARALRLACPCAACVDEVTGHVRLIASSIAETVRPVTIEVVGRYAIAIHWSDGHATGIYTFELLRKLAQEAG